LLQMRRKNKNIFSKNEAEIF